MLPDWQPFDASAGALPAGIEPETAVIAVAVHPDVGRTWSAEATLGLAMALASVGRNVFVMDLDLDVPGLHVPRGMENKEGVADALLYGASLRRIAHAMRPGGFLLATAGTVVGDTRPVLEHEGWESILDGFREAGATAILHVPVGAAGADAILEHADAIVSLASPSSEIGDRVVAARLGPSTSDQQTKQVGEPLAVSEPDLSFATVEETSQPEDASAEAMEVVDPTDISRFAPEDPEDSADSSGAETAEEEEVLEVAAIADLAPADVSDLAPTDISDLAPAEPEAAADDAGTEDDVFSLSGISGSQYDAASGEGTTPPSMGEAPAGPQEPDEPPDPVEPFGEFVEAATPEEPVGGEAASEDPFGAFTETPVEASETAAPEEPAAEPEPEPEPELEPEATAEAHEPEEAGIPRFEVEDSMLVDEGDMDAVADSSTMMEGIETGAGFGMGGPPGEAPAPAVEEVTAESDAPIEAKDLAAPAEEVEAPVREAAAAAVPADTASGELRVHEAPRLSGLEKLERQQKRRDRTRKVALAIVTFVVLGGGGYGLAYSGLVQVPGITPPERLGSGVLPPVELPGPQPTTPELSHSLLMDTYRELETPVAVIDALSERLPDVVFFISPVMEGERQLFALYAAAFSAPEADALRDPISEVRDRLDPSGWRVVPTPYAFFLGEFGTVDEADGRVASLMDQGIPTYVLQVDYSDDSVGYRVYAGAHVDELQAGPMGLMLRSGGITDAPLTSRRGKLPE
jgi:hypothetical protein